MQIKSDKIKTNWLFTILWKTSSIISILGALLFLGMTFNYIERNEMMLIIVCIMYVTVKSLVFHHASPEWLVNFNKSGVKQILKDQPIIGPFYLLLSVANLLALLTFQMYGWYIFLITNITMIVVSKAYADEHQPKNTTDVGW